jgi:DNA-directed RNA polymerase specialized sigma24 family protein
MLANDWTDQDWSKHREVLARKYGEDIAQQAILALWEQLAEGKDIARPTEWMSVTAKNFQKMQWRHESCVPMVPLTVVLASADIELPGSLIDTNSPEVLAIKAEEVRQLAALRALDRRKRSYLRKTGQIEALQAECA